MQILVKIRRYQKMFPIPFKAEGFRFKKWVQVADLKMLQNPFQMQAGPVKAMTKRAESKCCFHLLSAASIFQCFMVCWCLKRVWPCFL
jgi:hypothetical protein